MDSHTESTGPMGLPDGSAEVGSTAVLDRIAARGQASRRGERLRRALPDLLAAAARWSLLLPASALVIELLRWASGARATDIEFGPALLLILVPVALLVVVGVLKLMRAADSRRANLLRVDRRLKLEDRMTTADEFSRLQTPTRFQAAALADAEQFTSRALSEALAAESAPASGRSRMAPVLTLAGAFLCVFAITWVSRQETELDEESVDVSFGSDGVVFGTRDAEPDPADEAEAPADLPAEDPTEAPERPDPIRDDSSTERIPPQLSESPPPLDQREKEAAGRTGSGRATQAEASASQSEARANSSNQQQSPQAAEQRETPQREPKDPKEPKAERPEEQPEPSQDESGASAGRGASRGSTSNPTNSPWESKDQVEAPDENEVENEDEVDDEDEEQDARGGVQPSLRDRKPPVNRDLQIGFGNQPNPDANGRGGPSEQKKSRGVASLVLGVPLPDRVRGQPNAGRIRITQERILPTAEVGSNRPGETRGSRSDETGRTAQRDFDPAALVLIRNYFLLRRRTGDS